MFKLVFFYAFLGYFVFGGTLAEPSEQALRECGNVHHLDVHEFFNSRGEYVHFECALNCTIDGRQLELVPVNEGELCPMNSHGRCHHGMCVVSKNPEAMDDPVTECSNLNGINMHDFNNTGTRYENDHCLVLCYIQGQLASQHNINSGFPCSVASHVNGTCFDGQCVNGSVVWPTILPTERPNVFPVFKNISTYLVNTTFVSGVILETNENGEQNFQRVIDNSLCVKSKPIRVIENSNKCWLYCEKLNHPKFNCEAKPNEELVYFLFNVWSDKNATISVGNAFLNTEELYDQVKESADVKLKKDSNDHSLMKARTTLTLYNSGLIVGNITYDFEIFFKNKPF